MRICVEAHHYRRVALGIAFCWIAVVDAFGGGPRWVTGPPYFSTSGNPVVWYTDHPLYFTDPGDLSSYVNHAAADAIVAAAANVWNVPTASLVLAYGGALDEHVSGANIYLDGNGLVFPSDLQSANYQSKQIAVIYDTDGSVTDLLLGSGASDPEGCRQNAVTESVDSIVPAGYIQHALIILNGRCTGPAPEQQLQMQYQLMRAFGRVLGLGWSQVNDNVFTGSPVPTYYQALNWPIMHPIDIICGPYTYQCLPQPFTLRPDDLSALSMLYFIPQNQAPPGKVDTLYRAQEISGALLFPNGQGMQGVNVVARRFHQYWNVPEAWQSVSSVSGFRFKGANANPVSAALASTPENGGSLSPQYEGYYDIRRVPMLDGNWQNVYLDTEPINPLYTGQYAVGPYIANQVTPSGSNAHHLEEVLGPYRTLNKNLATNEAVSSCNSGLDGTETTPANVASSGWWRGVLCGYGHAAWSALTVRANRSFTIEVTAEDEQGFPSSSKAMPVIGAWNMTDAPDSLPSVAAAPTAFNGESIGMTTLTIANAQSRTLRFAIADQRGDGRPDYAYQARVLYADTLTPANVDATGGTITIAGTGFRTGNVVTVNGIGATVLSSTEKTIVATVPSSHTLGFTTAQTADVTITDLSTGGATVMAGALNYAAPQPTVNLVTAPSGTIFTGNTAATPFAVRVLSSNGITPMVNQSVEFTASGGVHFDACGGSSCTVLTNADGLASSTVTAVGPGTYTLSASNSYGTVSTSLTVLARIRTIGAAVPIQYIAAGSTVLWTPQVNVADNSAPVTGVLVTWQTNSGPMLLSPEQSQVDGHGLAQTSAKAGPLAANERATGSACAWLTICAALTVEGVDPEDWRLELINGAGQSVGFNDVLAPVLLRVTDIASHPIAGAIVEVHQTIDAWQMLCPDRGRCPMPPDSGSQASSFISDTDGMVTVIPRQLAGAAEVTNIIAATGTQGYISLSLQKHP